MDDQQGERPEPGLARGAEQRPGFAQRAGESVAEFQERVRRECRALRAVLENPRSSPIEKKAARIMLLERDLAAAESLLHLLENGPDPEVNEAEILWLKKEHLPETRRELEELRRPARTD